MGERRQLPGSVVVVTGATSGAGRATAEAFASCGAHLVLVARSSSALDEVERACVRLGARVEAVPADVGDAAAVDRVVERAVSTYGRIDTWVDMAAVLLAGRLEDVPVEDIERVVRTNVLGATFCSRAALRQFHGQGHGVLINTSSVLGVVPNPLVPVYTMTKFAVWGLTLATRSAFRRGDRITVCGVLPGPIDSPMFERAANHTGHVLRAIPPACAPERVAAAIVHCARRPRRMVVVGAMGKLVLVGMHVVPRATQWMVARYSASLLLVGRDAPDGPGTAFEPPVRGAISGDWRRGHLRRRLGASWGRWLTRAEWRR